MKPSSRYEVLFVAIPEISAEEIATLEKGFSELLKEQKASLISFEKWGKYRLSYQIRKNDYGVYFLTRFEIPEVLQRVAAVEAVRHFFTVKYHELVMRAMVVNLEHGASLDYHRPESLEETPAREEKTREPRDTMTMSRAESAVPSAPAF